jgi:biopolymer transport protein ExbD
LLTALLLILESRFFPTHGMVIDLPTMSNLAEEQAITRHAIALRDADHCIFLGEICSWDRLEKKLSTLRPEPGESLLLHCDRRTPLASLLRAGNLARRVGFQSIQIAMPAVGP